MREESGAAFVESFVDDRDDGVSSSFEDELTRDRECIAECWWCIDETRGEDVWNAGTVGGEDVETLVEEIFIL